MFFLGMEIRQEEHSDVQDLIVYALQAWLAVDEDDDILDVPNN